jgi:GGDEF domain-containing protein
MFASSRQRLNAVTEQWNALKATCADHADQQMESFHTTLEEMRRELRHARRLLARAGTQGSVRAIADKLVAAVAAPITLDGETVVVTASVGIALYPDDGESIDTLVSRADDGMYAAKRRAAAGAGSRR